MARYKYLISAQRLNAPLFGKNSQQRRMVSLIADYYISYGKIV